jgi:hypothetical protein
MRIILLRRRSAVEERTIPTITLVQVTPRNLDRGVNQELLSE